MKHAKKIVALLLAVILIAGVLPAASAAPVAGFPDVEEADWYSHYVQYVYDNKLMNGTESGFDPGGTCTRAMAAVVIFRLSGEKAPAGASGFTDLTQDWYKDGIRWAEAKAIVNGVGKNCFDPDGTLTREQLVTMLWRYAGKEKIAADHLKDFPDAKKIDSWAEDAFNWAIAKNIIGGSNGKLLPLNHATRAEFAKIIAVFSGCKPLTEEQKIIKELTEYSWYYGYRGDSIYEFDKDGTYHVYSYHNNTHEQYGIRYAREDNWTPVTMNKDLCPDLDGHWTVNGNHIHLVRDDQTHVQQGTMAFAEVTAEIFFKGSEGYRTWAGTYTGNSIIYETTFVPPDVEFGNVFSPFSLERLASRQDPELPDDAWRGVYFYDNSDYGEIFIVEHSDSTSVTGRYIFQGSMGDYGSRDFRWEILPGDTCVARERFQSGSYIYYRLNHGNLFVDYPDGWWPDRYYFYKCAPEDVKDVIQHPIFKNN